jgi:hypothetical protein
MKLAVLGGLLLVLAACPSKTGGGGPGPGPGSAVVTIPDVPFDQLDHDQKLQLMKQVVVPTMGPIFKKHDAQRYATFGCKTCHGDSADRGEFHMPNDELPKLNFADMSKFEPASIEWMKRDVKPTMAKLLKLPEHTEENPDGFGCLECHTQIGG